MSFDINQLISTSTGGNTKVAGNRRAKIFHYCTDDALATVAASGYFNSALSYLQKGDLILVSAVLSGTPACQLYVVNISGTTVTTVAAA